MGKRDEGESLLKNTFSESAVLSSAISCVVFFSHGYSSYSEVHWDLRDQYLDWAKNWFPATDVWDPPETLLQVLSKEIETTDT